MPFNLDFTEFMNNKVKSCDVQHVLLQILMFPPGENIHQVAAVIASSTKISEIISHFEDVRQRKEERITILETENALMHLKIAKLESQLQNERVQRNLGEEEGVIAELNRSHALKTRGARCLDDVQGLKACLGRLRDEVCGLPLMVQPNMEPALKLVQELDEKYRMRDSALKELQEDLQRYEQQLQETQERYVKEKHRRRELHNTLVELRGNIRVYCRARPVLAMDELTADTGLIRRSNFGAERVVKAQDEETLVVKCDRGGTPSSKSFEFERVFGPSDSQHDVFSDIKPLLTSLLDGYNVCMMAYGQTGSGKTYTMLGQEYTPGGASPVATVTGGHTHDGIIPRAGRELFRLIREKYASTFTVEVSVVEVYNNEIRDLLTFDPSSTRHDIYTAEDGSMEVTSVSTRLIHSVDDLIQFVHHGLTHRHEDATLVHDHSSRSHLVVTLTISGTPTPARIGQTAEEIVKTKLQLVDLAGSECVGVSGVKGSALRETSFINRSLSALADVLSALAEGRPHVPYRNSRLTHLLQDSIGGDAKLLLICCVSPTPRFLSETLQCLGFGSRARQVQRGPIRRRPALGSTSENSEGAQHIPFVRGRRSQSLTSIHSRSHSPEPTTPFRPVPQRNRFGYRGTPS